jgi:UDP-glucose 4-epimerase
VKILVTGGTGYIASHTLIELLAEGHEAVVVDNLINSSAASLDRVRHITGKDIPLYDVDCCDAQALSHVFDIENIDTVIHFAGLKAVGESVEQPLRYYRNNIDATLALCETMEAHDVYKLIFSSSATVYGTPERLPLDETCHIGIGITNPYGWTKYMIEQILRDLSTSNGRWQTTLLRYFNPVGAHESGLIGEDPNDMPNNLMPLIARTAIGRIEKLKVYGNDYDTPDGTGVRDYIHVVDLARGHTAALNHLPASGTVATYNLGTGKGVSVLEMIHAFEKASGKKVPYEIVERRAGDLPIVYANASKAEQELGWKTAKTIEEACADSWRWQSQNPNGFHATDHSR